MNILYIISTLSFFILGSYSIYDDYINRNNLDSKKIQIKTVQHLKSIYIKIYKLVLINMLIVTYPLSLFSYSILDSQQKSFESFNILYELFYFFILHRYLVDVFFYIFHYIFHTKYLKKFHLIHHTIHEPIGISAFYSHPIDFVFGNIFPLFLPCFIFKCHLYTMCLIIISTLHQTIFVGHSGNSNFSEFHDNHHKHYIVNYGTNAFMDKLFNTYKLT